MTSLNKIKKEFEKDEFELDHESNMVQSRLLSPIIEAIEKQGITQAELSKKTGLQQPFISALLNIRKKLNMEHIALFQKALGIVIQSPQALSRDEHKHKFYNKEEYELPSIEIFEARYPDHPINYLDSYSNSRQQVDYASQKIRTTSFLSDVKVSIEEYKADKPSI